LATVVGVPNLLVGNNLSSTSKVVTRCFALGVPLKMASASEKDYKNASSIYEFRAKDIDGNDVSMDKYKGLVVLIVNVACK
jgi:hypothetical protein